MPTRHGRSSPNRWSGQPAGGEGSAPLPPPLPSRLPIHSLPSASPTRLRSRTPIHSLPIPSPMSWSPCKAATCQAPCTTCSLCDLSGTMHHMQARLRPVRHHHMHMHMQPLCATASPVQQHAAMAELEQRQRFGGGRVTGGEEYKPDRLQCISTTQHGTYTGDQYLGSVACLPVDQQLWGRRLASQHALPAVREPARVSGQEVGPMTGRLAWQGAVLAGRAGAAPQSALSGKHAEKHLKAALLRVHAHLRKHCRWLSSSAAQPCH